MRLRFKADTKPFGIRQCMSAFRLHDASKTTTVWPKFEAGVRRHPGRVSTVPVARWSGLRWRAGRRRLLATQARDRMWRAIQAHDRPAARREALAVAGNRPLSVESWKGLYFALRAH